MKGKLLIFYLITLALGLHSVFAQQVSISSVNTVSGTYYGAEAGYFKNGWGMSAFYQTKNYKVNEVSEKQQYTGIAINIPIKHYRDISISLNLKGGITGNKFVVITPFIESQIRIYKFVKIGFGGGFRYGLPALESKLILCWN